MEWIETVSGTTSRAVFIAGHVAATLLGGRLSVFDWREHRLPNPLVRTLAIITLVTGAAGIGAGAPWGSSVDALKGLAIFAGPILLTNLISPATMGFGDVKLAMVLGLWIGWHGSGLELAALLGAFVLACPEALWRLTRRADRELAFGPYLIAAAIVAVAANFTLP